MEWSILAIVTSIYAVATIALAVGAFLAAKHYSRIEKSTKEQIESSRKQLEQMKISTQAQIAVELFRELSSIKQKRILREHIYTINRDEVVFPKEIEYKIEDVLNKIDMLGVLVRKEVIDADFAIQYGGATALRCWFQLRDWVVTQEESEGTNRFENFRYLVSRILEYANKHHSKDNWILFLPPRINEPINMVNELNRDDLVRPSNAPN